MSTTLDYLIPDVRLRIGDLDAAMYRYLDSWLLSALQLAVRSLSKNWNYKYLIDNTGTVTRNPNCPTFLFDEATYGTIQPGDDSVIVLLASIFTLEGSLENSSWNFASWKDNEISVSSQEMSRTKNEMLRRLLEEFNSLVPSPMKRLARVQKGSLPGYNPSGSVGYEKKGF